MVFLQMDRKAGEVKVSLILLSYLTRREQSDRHRASREGPTAQACMHNFVPKVTCV